MLNDGAGDAEVAIMQKAGDVGLCTVRSASGLPILKDAAARSVNFAAARGTFKHCRDAVTHFSVRLEMSCISFADSRAS